MPVGLFSHNDFGLYDVLGNVWEWTNDCLRAVPQPTGSNAENLPPAAFDAEGQQPTGSNAENLQPGADLLFCLARGASWDNHENWKVRADYWEPLDKYIEVRTVGFRVVREMDDQDIRGTLKCKECDTDCDKCFKDCENCPEMVIIPEGVVQVRQRPHSEKEQCEQASPSPTHSVPVKRLAIGKCEVTLAEWNACTKCDRERTKKQAREHRPVTEVSWDDAIDYVKWLTEISKPHVYRLPSGNEWEYAARGGPRTDSRCRYWGNKIGNGNANCTACGMTWTQFFDALGIPFGD